MSRYRPPAVPKSPLITPEGYKVLQDELDYLWRVKRPEITRSVSEAAAQGDRSENAP
jgi:transcription elongation factor GreB